MKIWVVIQLKWFNSDRKIGINDKMLVNSLSDWRKILLVREEPFSSLSEIFVLSRENSKGLQVSEELGAPSFMRRLSKRWCQWKDVKGGRRLLLPPSPSPVSPEKRI